MKSYPADEENETVLHAINRLAEFKDKNMEREFHNNEVIKGLRATRYLILIFSVINFLFVILDYLYLEYNGISIILYYSLIPRIIVLAAGTAFFLLVKNARNQSAAIHCVIAYTVLMYLLHEYMAMHFAPVDLIFEALDLVFISFCLFIIPNRWIVNTVTAALLVVIFMALTPLTIPTMEKGTKVILTVYLFSQVLIVGTLMHRINTQKRLNYLQQLQLEVMARTDALTNSPNRAFCDKTLDQMCGSQSDFSLILFDLDDFKQVNDRHGHLAGDEVIVKIIDAVKKMIRQDDVVARWGGEEFVVILPHTTRGKANEIAERIKEHLAEIKHANGIGTVTASFGVTEYVERDSTKSIIHRADQLLYVAKNHGKNIVVSG